MDSLLTTILDATVLDNVAKNHFDQHGNLVYRKLPAVVSQQVVVSVKDAWNGYFASIKIHSVDDSGFTGRPKYPGYLPKNGTYPVEIPYQMLSNKTGGFPKPKNLSATDKADVEQLERFYEIDFQSLIQEACIWRGFDDYKAQHVRIVGKTVKEMKIEAVINLQQVFPEGSLLKCLYTEHGQTIREFKRNKDRLKFIRDWVSDKDSLKVAGLDFGARNLVTCAFSTGNRGVVYSGERYASHISNFDELIDAFVSENTPDRLKELDAKADMRGADGDKIKLSPNEKRERRTLRAAIYTHPEYIRLRTNKANWKKDYLHKITHSIVETCCKYGIQAIVMGRNKGWKEEVNMKTSNNRNFYSVAHNQLQNMIRYKAERYGIVVVETEESYTSKSSFVDGDNLLQYEADTKKAADKAEVKYSGYRSSKNRNWFVRRKDMLKSIKERLNNSSCRFSCGMIGHRATEFDDAEAARPSQLFRRMEEEADAA